MGVPAAAVTFLAAGFISGAGGLSILPAPERPEQQANGNQCRLLCHSRARTEYMECMTRCDQSYATRPKQLRNATQTVAFPAAHAGLQVAHAHTSAAESDEESGVITTFVLSVNASANASAWKLKAELDLKEGLSPHMSPAERRLFKRYLTSATNYFEFGSGGSTEWAAKAKNLKHIHTIESDADWISTLKRRDAVRQAEKDGRLRLEHVDIGPTGAWGRPIGRSSSYLWHRYSDGISTASEAQWDLIFVDGRFRVSCLLKSLLQAPRATLIIHDYKNRPQYHSVERFARKVTSTDTLYVFRLKQDVDMQSLQWAAQSSETDPA